MSRRSKCWAAAYKSELIEDRSAYHIVASPLATTYETRDNPTHGKPPERRNHNITEGTRFKLIRLQTSPDICPAPNRTLTYTRHKGVPCGWLGQSIVLDEHTIEKKKVTKTTPRPPTNEKTKSVGDLFSTKRVSVLGKRPLSRISLTIPNAQQRSALYCPLLYLRAFFSLACR